MIGCPAVPPSDIDLSQPLDGDGSPSSCGCSVSGFPDDHVVCHSTPQLKVTLTRRQVITGVNLTFTEDISVDDLAVTVEYFHQRVDWINAEVSSIQVVVLVVVVVGGGGGVGVGVGAAAAAAAAVAV